MDKSKFEKTLIIITAVFIAVIIFFLIFNLATSHDGKSIEVEISVGEEETLEFEEMSLLPGEECGYTVRFRSAETGRFNVELEFIGDADQPLARFARVALKAKNGEQIKDALLSDLLDGEITSLPISVADELNEEITVTFYLPSDVVNEAKNAEAAFELLITATNE